MTVQAVKAISVLGAVAATLATGDALADGHGHGYGHYRAGLRVRASRRRGPCGALRDGRPSPSSAAGTRRCAGRWFFKSRVRPWPAASSALRSATSWVTADSPPH